MRLPKGFRAPAPGLETRSNPAQGGVSSTYRRIPEQIVAPKTSKSDDADAELDARPTRPRRGMRRLFRDLVDLATSGRPDAEREVVRRLRRMARLCRCTAPVENLRSPAC